MKRIAVIVSIVLAACIGGALATAFAMVGAPPNLSSSSAAAIPAPPTSQSSTSAPQLEITNSASQSAVEETGEAEPQPQPAPVPFEGGVNPVGDGSALEGSWHYYEGVPGNTSGATVMAYQYRFYNESNNMNLNYGEFGANIGINMLGTFSLAGDGTLVLSDITWSSADDLLGHTGGQAVFSLGWPADGQAGLVLTLQSYDTGTGEGVPVFDHIIGVPLLCAKFGEQSVDLG